MSGSLIEIKKQISGTKNTRKITKAMELVASSKMRKFQKRAVAARNYLVDLSKILHANLNEQLEHFYTEKRQKGKTLFVLYTSDKGLCGSLNNKLINTLFRSEQWKSLTEDQRALITIGKKSLMYANNNGIKVEKHFVGVPEKMTDHDSVKIVDEIIEMWRKGTVKEIIFVSPYYKNSFTFYPEMKTFLPFSKDSLRANIGDKAVEDIDHSNTPNHNMIFSPEEELVLKRLYQQIIKGMFAESFLELKASEYSSRMIAMQNATDAADKRILELKKKYNKARQQAITQEIAELIGASMALQD